MTLPHLFRWLQHHPDKGTFVMSPRMLQASPLSTETKTWGGGSPSVSACWLPSTCGEAAGELMRVTTLWSQVFLEFGCS